MERLDCPKISDNVHIIDLLSFLLLFSEYISRFVHEITNG